MNSDDLNAIAALAFCSVDSPDWDSFYRKICRWFSKNYSVPLPQVENELSEEYVLRHYFEDMYVNLSESNSDESHKQWAETKGRIAALFKEKASDEDVDEDSYWEKALEEEFKRDNPHLEQQKPKEKSKLTSNSTDSSNLKEDGDGWTHAPNLPEEVNIQANDPIPEE